MSDRTTDLAKIHMAAKYLALTDESYRALLHRIAGVDSAADLDIAGRVAVLKEFARRGWKAKSKKAAARGVRPGQDAGAVRKLRALWIDLHQRGIVRDPGEAALASFVSRFGRRVSAVQWASPAQVRAAIEAAKAMRDRGAK